MHARFKIVRKIRDMSPMFIFMKKCEVLLSKIVLANLLEWLFILMNLLLNMNIIVSIVQQNIPCKICMRTQCFQVMRTYATVISLNFSKNYDLEIEIF